MHTVHALFAGGVALTLASCSVETTAESRGAPTPSASTDQVVTAAEIDSLPLSDTDLAEMGISYKRQNPETVVPDWGTVDQSNPCQQVEWVSALQPWSAFRWVSSRGPDNFGIHQAVAVYPDEQAARNSFRRYSGYAADCSRKGGGETFTVTTSSELAWSLPTVNEVGELSGNLAAWNIRIVKNVVVDVGSTRRADGVAMTARIADQIVAKVTSAA